MEPHPSYSADSLGAAIPNPDDEALIPSAEGRRMAGGISTMTEWRWRRDGLLPKPVQVRGRNYYRRGAFIAALRSLGTAGAE